MSEDDAKKIILDHPLPKARQRTNIVSEDYVPEGRLFGAFTTRGEGITQATFRFPLAVKALMVLASTREGPCADEGFLSAQVNCGISLPVHKDKNNHGETWLIGLGDYTGGRLWIESPCGQHPPPVIARKWQESLRGDLVDVRNKWYRFDPRCYHAVEPVESGRRVSVALFSPRSWKRIPPHALCELQDLGFHPPRAAGAMSLDQPKVERTQDDIPGRDSKNLGDLGDTPRKGPKTLGYLEDSPGMGQAMPADDTVERSEDDKEEDLRTSTHGMDADLQEWCLLPEVSLPFAHLDASDGSISPLDNDAMEELKKHIQSGHLTKSHLCKGCLTAEGPRRIHKRVRDVDKATHVLHIDIAGPLTQSDDGYVYFLVGALRLPGFPLLIDVRLLQTRTSAEVCHQLDVMVNYFESLCFEGFPITDAPRIRRLHSDRAREFTAAFFEKFLAHRRGIYHTLTTGYDPQANGTAERAVGLIKALASRCLMTSGMDSEFWSYAVRYAAQSLICAGLQRHQRSPPFGSQVIAQALGHGMIKFPTERSVSGRLLFWDHLSDQGSCILCHDVEHDEWTVYRAGLPVLAPPDVIPTPDAHDDHPGRGSDSDAQPGSGIDNSRLRTDEPGRGLSKFDRPLRADSDTPFEIDDDAIEIDHADLVTSEGECDHPFSFFYLSSEDCRDGLPEVHNIDDVDVTPLDPVEPRKQATSHINVTSEEVARTTGEQREQWLEAGRKEIDNLTSKRSEVHKVGALEPINATERDKLKSRATIDGYQYIELPAKVVWTIKPDKFKCRIVACGNQTQDIYGRTSTTDLDTQMLRFILSWGASSSEHKMASLDITAAFLNAELPPGRVVVLRPPSILYRLGLIPQGFCWRVHRAIYGLREAPSLWQDERTSEMTKVKFKVQGETAKVIVSQVHQSLCMIVKERDLIDNPEISQYGITKRVEPSKILAMIGIYVDDYLTVGQPETVEKFLSYLRRLWNTSDPQYLSQSNELPFLGLTIQRSPSGLFLHQVQYAELLLEEHAAHIPKRARTTTGEAESFKEEQNPAEPPDMSNPEHLSWIKLGQKIIGALLWLSTRTRPDLSCAVSLVSQALFKDLKKLKDRLRHLLQYLKSTKNLGLSYPFPKGASNKFSLTEFTVYTDSSFAPAGKQSQTGIAVFLTYGTVRHLIHWQSGKEKKMAESSAESELYALSTGHKVGRNFRLMVHETLADDILLNLRCDNEATIAMLDNPSWRTRYLSIYGETIRQEVKLENAILTYVDTNHQLADVLTKPTSAAVNDRIYPLWGLIPKGFMNGYPEREKAKHE